MSSDEAGNWGDPMRQDFEKHQQLQRTLFISLRNTPDQYANRKKIFDIFNKFGKTETVYLKEENQIAFVKFAKASDASDAIEQLNEAKPYNFRVHLAKTLPYNMKSNERGGVQQRNTMKNIPISKGNRRRNSPDGSSPEDSACKPMSCDVCQSSGLSMQCSKCEQKFCGKSCYKNHHCGKNNPPKKQFGAMNLRDDDDEDVPSQRNKGKSFANKPNKGWKESDDSDDAAYSHKPAKPDSRSNTMRSGNNFGAKPNQTLNKDTRNVNDSPKNKSEEQNSPSPSKGDNKKRSNIDEDDDSFFKDQRGNQNQRQDFKRRSNDDDDFRRGRPSASGFNNRHSNFDDQPRSRPFENKRFDRDISSYQDRKPFGSGGGGGGGKFNKPFRNNEYTDDDDDFPTKKFNDNKFKPRGNDNNNFRQDRKSFGSGGGSGKFNKPKKNDNDDDDFKTKKFTKDDKFKPRDNDYRQDKKPFGSGGTGKFNKPRKTDESDEDDYSSKMKSDRKPKPKPKSDSDEDVDRGFKKTTANKARSDSFNKKSEESSRESSKKYGETILSSCGVGEVVQATFAVMSERGSIVVTVPKESKPFFAELCGKFVECCNKQDDTDYRPRQDDEVVAVKVGEDWFRAVKTNKSWLLLDDGNTVNKVFGVVKCPEKYKDQTPFAIILAGCEEADAAQMKSLKIHSVSDKEVKVKILDNDDDVVGVFKVEPLIPAPLDSKPSHSDSKPSFSDSKPSKSHQDDDASSEASTSSSGYSVYKSGCMVFMEQFVPPNVAYVRLIDEESNLKFMNILQIVSSEGAKVQEEEQPMKSSAIKNNALCLVKNDEGVFCRGKIQIDKDKEDDNNNYVKVLFIDKARYGRVKRSNVYPTNKVVNDLPRMMHRMILAGVPEDYNYNFRVWSLKEKIEKLELIMTFSCSYRELNSAGVTLTTTEGTNINNRLKKFLTPVWKLVEEDLKNDVTDIQHYMYKDMPHLNLESESKLLVRNTDFLREQGMLLVMPWSPPIKMDFNWLRNQINEYCERITDRYSPRQDEICAVRAQDGTWVRGVCLELRPLTILALDDVGEFKPEIDDVRKLPGRLATYIPMMVYRAKLLGLPENCSKSLLAKLEKHLENRVLSEGFEIEKFGVREYKLKIDSVMDIIANF